MRKERVVISALRRWESAKKRTREETIVETNSFPRRVETPLRCAPTFSLPRLSPKKREPQTKKKEHIEGTNPPRGDASASTLGDHHRIVLFVGRPLSPKSLSLSLRDRGRATPPFPRSMHHPRLLRRDFFPAHKRNALIPRKITYHLSSCLIGPRFSTGVRTSENEKATPVRVAFCFSLRKKRTIFSSSSSTAALLL